MVKRREWVFNGLTISAILLFAFASLIWPASNIAADTTGEFPNHDIIDYQGFLEDKGIDLLPYSQADLDCLATNMYFEARSDGSAGMYATTMVVMNRVADSRYPDTVCGVVKEGPIKESWKTAQHKNLLDEDRVFYPIRNKCQFSWYCDGKADTMYDKASVHIAEEIAHLVLSLYNTEIIVDITEGATHYHATSVTPYWIGGHNMARVTQIGSHIFYRWD